MVNWLFKRRPSLALLLIDLALLVGISNALTRELQQSSAASATRHGSTKFSSRSSSSYHHRSTTTSLCSSRSSRLFSEPERQRQQQPRPIAEPPTQTMFDSMGPRSIPAKPKIVVLGATGRIGRQVVKQLLQMKGVDMEIIAFCRSYEKALRVLYDDQLVLSRQDEINLLSQNGPTNNQRRGPKLQIVEGDLVPEEELPGYAADSRYQFSSDNNDDDEEAVWLEKAESAARFYGTKVEDYDNSELLPDINESLEDAIRDATTIINVVGSVRMSNIWTDFLARPVLRLLNPDVSSWCNDAHHPFYVHYMSTKKALGFAEREQLRREAAATTIAEAEGLDVEKDLYVPRIRFIRVSDLNVAQNPWNLIPLMTNIFRSLVFRYEEMGERELASSTLVDSVIIRPGDLCDDERDVNTTAVEVSSSGVVASPNRIGRDDVATLVVEAARFIAPNKTSSEEEEAADLESQPSSQAFHYAFAARWVGQAMDPYPSQGRKRDGHEPSHAFRKALKVADREDRIARRKARLNMRLTDPLSTNNSRKRIPTSSSWSTVQLMARRIEERKLQRQKNRHSKPHGICVAIAVYSMMAIVCKALLIPSLQYFPAGRIWINRVNKWIWFALGKIVPWLVRGKKRPSTYISF